MLVARGRERRALARAGNVSGSMAIGEQLLSHELFAGSWRGRNREELIYNACFLFPEYLNILNDTNHSKRRRFIPNREGQDLQASFSLLHEDGCPATPSKVKRRAPHGELHFQKSQFLPTPTTTSNPCPNVRMQRRRPNVPIRGFSEANFLETPFHSPI
jgi:hypothetical protein